MGTPNFTNGWNRTRKIRNFSIKPGKDDFFENCHFQNPVQMTDSHFHSFVYPELLRSYDFGKFGADPSTQARLANHTLGFRNLRTGKTHEFHLPPTLAEKLDVNATSICPVTKDDVIQIRLLNPQTGEVLFSDSQVIDATGEPLCHVQIHLEEAIRRIVDHLPILTPVRRFVIGMDQKALLGQEPSSPTSKPSFVAVNTRTDIRAKGRANGEQPDYLYFTLTSPGEADVVQTGDILEIRSDAPQERVQMRFRLTPEDVAAYGRFIGADEGNLLMEV